MRLSFIVGSKEPSILFLPRYPWGPDDAREEVDRQAALLERYCADILNGDLSEWASLEAHQEQVLEQWRGESERLVKEARGKLVRRRAEAASIKDDLTQAEIARQEYCRRRTLLVSVPREPRVRGLA